MKEVELIEKRKFREKHFLQEDGTIRAEIYDDNIHYLENGKYEEIDNTLIEKNGYYSNKNNSYKAHFSKNSKNDLFTIENDKHYLSMYLKNSNTAILERKNKNTSKLEKKVNYKEILDGIDFEYKLMPTKVKENIIIHNEKSINENIEFIIDTDLKLIKNKDKSISACFNSEEIFKIDVPYMIDSLGKTNFNITYNLTKKETGYNLKLNMDINWLKEEERQYPVYIDPTITNSTQNTEVYDTYIYPGDTNVNRSTQEYFKVGVDRINGNDVVNRALIKFDLPTIGTGSQVISATLNIANYPSDVWLNPDICNLLSVHQVTSNWTESGANWNNMSNNYNNKVEDIFSASRSYADYQGNLHFAKFYAIDITKIVKKWYTNTPNYGLLLKAYNEVYQNDFVCAFFSKNNTVLGNNPKPVLVIAYRNQNGIEEYMDYREQKFKTGSSYVNTYNGNLVCSFDCWGSIYEEVPYGLNIIYNTNDVILNKNVGYGKGWKLNYNQYIEKDSVNNWLAYTDEDGTIHYFHQNAENNDGKYYDEDNINMIITEDTTTYTMTDKNGNQYIFMKNGTTAALQQIINTDGLIITIYYNLDNKISRIDNSKGESLIFDYQSNSINITSDLEQIALGISNGKLASISNRSGTVLFNYNSSEIINKIVDVTGKGVEYQYYTEVPYRIKKVIELGTNNTVGKTLEFNYSFNCTTICDNNNRINNLGYNNYGSVLTNSDFINDTDVKNAHCLNNYYEQFEPNDKIGESVPISYVKNYLKNTSFEYNDYYFNSVDDVIISISDDFSNSGTYSLKVVSQESNTKISQTVVVPKLNEYYTFSLYSKNTGNIRIGLSYLDENNDLVEELSEIIYPSTDFERNDITIKYSDTASSAITINIFIDDISILYIDDVQLEEGETASHHNIIENSNFIEGLNDWTITGNNSYELIDLGNNNKALKVQMNVNNDTSLSMDFPLCGGEGNVYNLSFWYKNEGLNTRYDDSIGTCCRSIVWVNYNYDDPETYVPPATSLDNNNDEWHYFSKTFTALGDFTSINFTLELLKNVNNFYITDLYLYKDYKTTFYAKDFNGNLFSMVDFAGNSNDFKYDNNNQLTKMLNPKGNSFVFEYDNEVKTRTLRGISPTGISNIIRYDNDGKPAFTQIINKGLVQEINQGKYQIRLKGTDKYLRLVRKQFLLESDRFGLDGWIISIEDEKYKFESIMFPNNFLNAVGNNLILGEYNSTYSLFDLISQDDGSYAIKSVSTNKCLNNDNDILSFITDVQDITDSNKFYIEKYGLNEFIEHSAKYGTSNNFISLLTDSNFRKIVYDVDDETGLKKSMTNPKKQITEYEYNQDDLQIRKVTNGNKEIQFLYDSRKLLDEIITGNKNYIITYNPFLNISSISIGNTVLSTKEYGNGNEKISKITYANNDIIKYSYDNFDRLSKVEKEDNNIYYKYNKNGNLAKIITDNDTTKFDYDSSQRLRKYKYEDFEIDYIYSNNNNLVNKTYKYINDKYNIEYTYDEDENIVKTKYDTNTVDYSYDELGRIVSISINNSLQNNYEYYKNGYRTSLLTKKYNNGFNQYTYKYNKMNDITHIYMDGTLTNKFIYDEYNQLIRECNYVTNQITNYSYDFSGNIQSKKVINLNNFSIIDEKKYEYNDSNWEDKLTSFNNNLITYDSIGNPLSIGSDIVLTWENGRELSGYQKNNTVVSYKYNAEGIRNSKIVNGVETKYYLDGTQIIFETCENNTIYYLKNETNGLIGFKLNNQIYFYLKNLCGDIVGIVDNNNTIVARYTYDAYGNTISITDGNGMDVSSNSNHIANINKYRYRSYYFDNETGFYYLNSRYYNPAWGRFINADCVINANHDFNGYNLYIYASNNPMNLTDESGKSIFVALTIAAFVGALAGLASQYLSDNMNSAMSGKKKRSSAATYIGSAVGGAVGGVCTFLAFDPFSTSLFSSGVKNMTTNTIELLTTGKRVEKKKFVYDLVVDTAIGTISGNVMKGLDMPGITNGRNSFDAVFKTGLTKIANNNQSKMGIKVLLKGFTDTVLQDTYGTYLDGMKGYIDDLFSENNPYGEFSWGN